MKPFVSSIKFYAGYADDDVENVSSAVKATIHYRVNGTFLGR